MLTQNALATLSDSLRGQRVLSVYIDGRATDPAARLVWRSTVAGNLATLRANIAEHAADERQDFDRCRALLDQELASISGALGAPGFVAFITTDRVAFAERLPVPMPNVTEWRYGPWVSPYLRAQKELRAVILAVVDARSARSYRYELGTLSPLEHFHAHVHLDLPPRMGNAPRQAFHTGTRGAARSDALHRARQHGTKRMLRELVEHIVSVSRGDEWIVIGGMPPRATVVLTMLPPAVRQRAVVVAGLSPTTGASTLLRAAREHARGLRQRLDRAIVDAAISNAGKHGRGSVGEESTREALTITDVHMLLMSATFMNDHADAAEELARLALAGSATIEVVSPPADDRLNREGGVAAILRYVAPSAPAETTAEARA